MHESQNTLVIISVKRLILNKPFAKNLNLYVCYSFLEGSVVDHRDVKLQAVKLRYGEEKFHKVSEIPIMSYEELCAMLGVTEHILQGTDVCVKFRNADELILSPSRKKRKCERYVHVFLWQQIYISNNMYLKKKKISHSMDVN